MIQTFQLPFEHCLLRVNSHALPYWSCNVQTEDEKSVSSLVPALVFSSQTTVIHGNTVT